VSEAEARTLAVLRADGRRITTARKMVIGLLARTTEHLTADDLASRIHAARPEIHLSTVYRTLDSLCAWGLVEHVHQPHGPSFFHLAGAHRHLVCEQCGRIRDVPAAEFDALVTRFREQYAFELSLGHAALVGRCSDHVNVNPIEFSSVIASAEASGSESGGMVAATEAGACSST
jgi:Fur family transcriptional regulator, ferric uptake regulator